MSTKASNISVSVRIRPIKKNKTTSAWKWKDNALIQVDPETGRTVSTGAYQYDNIFDPSATTQCLYDGIARPVCHKVLHGINGTIFAYGQTSSGKTHTMQGTPKAPGIIPLAIHEIFDRIAEIPDREFLLRVSFMEIYNEQLRDLLNPTRVKKLRIHEDAKRGVYVGDLTEECVASAEQVMQVLEKGFTNRSVGHTHMNHLSSRSHSIFRLVVESRAADDDLDSVRVASLNLVDLAGSERIRKTEATGKRKKEGAHINQSLSTLGNVISKLSHKHRSTHIPYRDSKLTRILQPALGGNSCTAIICTITPALEHADETLSTLKFANRAKKITNSVKVNEVLDDATMLQRYRRQIQELTSTLEGMKAKLAEGNASEGESTDKENIQQQEARLAMLQRFIVNGRPMRHTSLLPSAAVAARRQTWVPRTNSHKLVSEDTLDLPLTAWADAQRCQDLDDEILTGASSTCSSKVSTPASGRSGGVFATDDVLGFSPMASSMGEQPCTDASAEVAALQQRVTELEEQLAQKEDHVEQLNELTDTLTAEQDEVEDRLRAALQKGTEQQRRADEAEERLSFVMDKLDESDERLTDLRRKCDMLEGTVRTANERSLLAEEARLCAEAKLSDCRKELKEYELKMENYDSMEMELSRFKWDELQAKAKSLVNDDIDPQASEQRLADAKAAWEEREAELNQTISQLQQVNATSDEELARLRSELKTLQQHHTDLLGENKELQDHVDQLTQLNDELQQSFDEANGLHDDTMASVAAQAQQAQELFSAQKDALTQLWMKLASEEEAGTREDSEIMVSIAQRVDHLLEQQKSLQEDVADAQAAKTASEEALQRAQQQHEAENADLQSAVDQATSMLTAAETERDATIVQEVAAAEARLADSESEVERLAAELARCQAETRDAEEHLEKAQQTWDMQVQALAKEMEEVAEERDELLAIGKALEAERDALLEQTEQSHDVVQDLESKLSAAQGMAAQLSRELKSVKASEAASSKHTSSTGRDLEKAKAREAQLQDRCQQLARDKSALTSEKATVEREMRRLLQANKKLQRTLDKAESKDSKRVRAAAQVDRLTKQAESNGRALETMKARCELLESEATVAAQTETQLRQELAEAQQALESLQAQHEEATSQLKAISEEAESLRGAEATLTQQVSQLEAEGQAATIDAAQAHARIEELSQAMREAQLALDEAGAQAEANQAEQATLKESVSQLQQHVTDSEMAGESLRSQVELLQSQLDQMQQSEQAMCDQLTELGMQAEEAKARAQAAETALEATREEVEARRQAAATAKDEAAAAKVDAELATEAAAAADMSREAAELRSEQLQHMLDSARAELKEVNTALARERVEAKSTAAVTEEALAEAKSSAAAALAEAQAGAERLALELEDKRKRCRKLAAAAKTSRREADKAQGLVASLKAMVESHKAQVQQLQQELVRGKTKRKKKVCTKTPLSDITSTNAVAHQ